jgi:hypothetical protein
LKNIEIWQNVLIWTLNTVPVLCYFCHEINFTLLLRRQFQFCNASCAVHKFLYVGTLINITHYCNVRVWKLNTFVTHIFSKTKFLHKKYCAEPCRLHSRSSGYAETRGTSSGMQKELSASFLHEFCAVLQIYSTENWIR